MSKSKLLLIAYAAMGAGLLVFFLWTARIWPFDGYPEPVVVEFDELSFEYDTVTVSGTAHYPVRVSVDRPKRPGRPAATWWLYPVFAKGDIESRFITAMAMCPEEPERLVSFEDMTLTAWALPPGALPQGAAKNWEDRGYAFAEDFVVLECVLD